MLQKITCFTAFFLAFSLAVSAQTVQPTPPIEDDKDIIRIDSKLVQLDFMVLDKDNQQVKNLTTDDIEV